MPAAIAIPAIIGAVGSVAAAKIGSNAAQNAAQTQANAANQARQFQQQQFQQVLPYVTSGMQQAQQAFNPYQQLGQSAIGQLYQRLGMQPPRPQGYGIIGTQGFTPPGIQEFVG